MLVSLSSIAYMTNETVQVVCQVAGSGRFHLQDDGFGIISVPVEEAWDYVAEKTGSLAAKVERMQKASRKPSDED